MTTLDDIYRKFGETAEAAQLLETELGTLALMIPCDEADLIENPDPQTGTDIYQQINRHTRIYFLAFLVLVVASNATAQYAVKRFERLSGLKIKPRSNFVLCVGTSNDPLECKPTFGTQPWDKVDNIAFVTLDVAKETTDVDTAVLTQIINKYLGAGFGNGALDNSCIPADSPTNTTLNSVLYRGPVRSSGISQLVEEEIVKEAKLKFKTLIEANKLGNKGKLEAAFEAELRKEIKGQSSNRADIKWVVVQLQADVLRLKSFPSTKSCIEFARLRNGSLITGIAGFIIMSSAGSSDYVSTSSFKQAASVAFTATGSPNTTGLDNAVVEAAAQWSSISNQKITTTITTRSPQPTFYPLWVSFAQVN